MSSEHVSNSPSREPTDHQDQASEIGLNAVIEPAGLARILGWHDTSTFVAVLEETDAAGEALVQSCMGEQGFDYLAHTFGRSTRHDGLPAGLSDQEFRERYGYGIATGFANMLEMTPEEFADPGTADPNVRIRAELSPERRSEYDRAIGGADGCRSQAAAQVDRAGRLYDRFGADLAAMELSIEADERRAQLLDSWSSCMEQRGVQAADPAELPILVSDRLSPLTGEIYGDEIEPGTVIFDPTRPPSAEQLVDLQEIVDFELSMAQSDAACDDEVGVSSGLRRIRVDHEESFINANLDELQELFPDTDLS